MKIEDMPTVLLPVVRPTIPQDTEYELPIPLTWKRMIECGEMEIVPPSGTVVIQTYFLPSVRFNPDQQHDLAVYKFKIRYGVRPDIVYMHSSRLLYMTTSDSRQSDDSLGASLVRCVKVME